MENNKIIHSFLLYFLNESVRFMTDRRKYTKENFIDALKSYGYEYIDGEYENVCSKLKCYDGEGYIVYPCFDKLEHSLKSQ